MATIKLILKKLVDVDVEFVSLVKRGANRIPFRVIKSEDIKQKDQEDNTMNLFEKLFGTHAKDDSTEPQISAIIMDSQCNIEEVEKQLEELGFSVANKQEVEGGIVFRQSEFSEDDIVIRLSETTFVSITNVQKAFEPFASGTSFADNFNKGAFFPSVRMATDVLMDTIVNVMFTDAGAKAPIEAVEKVLNEFNKFVITSLKSIPRDAFKLEDIMVKAEKSASLDNENRSTKTEDEAVDMNEVKKVIKEELGDLVKTDGEKAVAKMEEIHKAIKETLVEVKSEIDKQLEKFKADIEALKAVSEGIDKRLEKSEEKTEAIEKAVKGTVAVGSSDGDPDKTDTEKSDEDVVDPWSGIMGQLDNHSAE